MARSDHHDSSGRTLADYPRPSVAVDTAVLTVAAGELAVLELYREDAGAWALPGTFLHPDETLRAAVSRSLRDKVGLSEDRLAGAAIDQLRVFDHPRRDPRGWVLSVAHVAVLPPDVLDVALSLGDRAVRLEPVDGAGDLAFDHPEIVRVAADHVRRDYALRPDPAGLLPDSFTLRELYDLHLAIAPRTGPGQARPSVDTFRRYMTRNDLVVDTGMTTEDRKAEGTTSLGAPARLYRRAGAAPELDLIDAIGVRPVRQERGRGEPRPIAPAELAGMLLDRGVSPVLADVLAEVAERTPVVAAERPSYVTLHPALGRPVAAYVHNRRVSIPLDPDDADALAAADPMIRVERSSARTHHVHVTDEALHDPSTRRTARQAVERSLARATGRQGP